MKKINILLILIFFAMITNVFAFDTGWDTDIFDGSSSFNNIINQDLENVTTLNSSINNDLQLYNL